MSIRDFAAKHPTLVLISAVVLLLGSIAALVYRPDVFRQLTAKPPESVFGPDKAAPITTSTASTQTPESPAPVPEATEAESESDAASAESATPTTPAPTPMAATATPAPTVALDTAPETSAAFRVVAAADTSGAPLRVVGTIPLHGDLLKNQIVFFFDGDIVPPKAADGSLSAPFDIAPPLPGRYRVGRNYVAFETARVDAHSVYEAVLSEQLQSVGGRKLVPEDRRFVFAPFAFGPNRLWTLEDQPDRSILGIAFPAPTAAEVLQQHVTVKGASGKDVPFKVEPGTSPELSRLTVEGGRDWPVTVTVTKGLPDATGKLLLNEDRTFTYPTARLLTVTNVSCDRLDTGQLGITLTFSAPVDSEQLKNYLAITDADTAKALPVEAITSGSFAKQQVKVTLPDSEEFRLQLTVAQGLPAAERLSLAAAYTTTVKRERPPLQIQDTWFNYDSKDGLVLHVGLDGSINVSDVKAHLEFAPALDDLRVEPSWDNRSFNVHGQWNSKQAYELKLTPGLKYGERGLLKTAVTYSVTADKVPPYLAFGQDGKYYFPRRAGLSLPIASRNLEKAQITLERMFPSNIAVAMASLNDGKGGVSFGAGWSEKITTKQIDLTYRQDRKTATPFDLDSLFPADKKGVFLLEIGSVETPAPARTAPPQGEADGEYEDDAPRNVSDTKIVLWTNIGLLAHWQEKELVLFAHNLYSLAPLGAAQVTVYSAKNQVLGKGATDERGIVHLKDFDPALGAPRVAVVEQGDDYSFLELKPRDDEGRPFSPDMPRYDREAYDAFLYADRDLYRPGEPVHLRWLVRKNYGDALSNVPLLLHVFKPNGRLLLTQPATLSAVGSGGMDLDTQKAYPTGKYEVQVAVPGAAKPIGAYSFNLEEFVPNRIKATVAIAEKQWLADQDYQVQVNAQHLFGAPAADRKCVGKVVLRREGLVTQNWKDYVFDNDSDYVPDPVELGEARTDEAGNAAFTFHYTAPEKVTFPLKAIATGRVFELGGRGVLGKAETVLWPSPIALGVSATAAEGGQGIQVFAAAINPDETPAALPKVSITLERQVWNYYVRRYYSDYEPRWSESFEPLETREVDLADGKASTAFAMSDYGYYRVRVHSEATKQFSTISFYSYGGQCRIVDAARPSLIKVTLDKASYAIGEQAEVKIESPFDGKGIVVVQGEEIQDMIPVDIVNNVGVIKLDVKKEQFPNVWVEVNVVHAIQQGRKQVYPFSSSALVNLQVRNPERGLTIAFPSLPVEIRPAAPVALDIDVRDAAGNPAPQAELTLAAVDEGIHSITDYKNPDPYQWVSRPRRPDYRRAHYYDKVAYDFEAPPIGGDSELALRVGTAGESWIKPVALWSGTVTTDANGHASVTLAVPEFTGQLRLVAVGCTASAVGSKGANVFVRRPYMLQTSLPRFLLPGDKFQGRAVFYNHTDQPCRAKVAWTAGGALQPGSGSRQLDVAAHGEAAVDAGFAARNALGAGEVRWDAVVTDAAGQEREQLHDVLPIPIHSPAGYQSAIETVLLKPGESREIRNTQFLDDERASVAVTVGANPMLRLQKALEYVIGYPYGCVEQTTSRLMPMYLLRQNAALTQTAFKDAGNLDNYIRAGIARLFAMQTASGGLGFWPGANDPAEYGSVYGLHFLTLVQRDHQYELPAQSLEALQNYVREIALSSERTDSPDLYLRAYALYVLALDGDLKAIQQIERFNDVKLPRPARFLLAAALAQNTKDLDRVKLYLSSTPSEPYEVTVPDAVLTSDIRNTAVELMALQQIGGDHDAMLEKANALTAFLEQRHYGNTQETAFIVTALSGYLGEIAANIDQAAATITAPDKTEELHGPAVYNGLHQGPGGVFTVSNTGPLELIVNVTFKGVPETVDLTPASAGLAVTRTFYTNRGVKLETAAFKQTDSFVVGLELTADQAMENVAVSDLLPAGFEIENPRLDEEVLSVNTFKGAEQPSFLEVRDDRLVLAFNELEAGTHRFYYVVRAVTPGTYLYPPVQAECMYDAALHGNSGAATITVEP